MFVFFTARNSSFIYTIKDTTQVQYSIVYRARDPLSKQPTMDCCEGQLCWQFFWLQFYMYVFIAH